MGTQLQKVNQTLQITKQNWPEKWGFIPAKADTPAAMITAMNVPALCQMGGDVDGDMMGITILNAQLTGLVEYIGAAISPAQINECAQLAYEQYYWLTLAELKQLMLRIKTGVYTSHKNFSPVIFMGFLAEYGEERMAARYDHYSQQKPQSNFEPDARPLKDEEMDKLKKIVGDIAKAMGEPIRQIMDEEEYQRIKAEYTTKQMQQKTKDEQ